MEEMVQKAIVYNTKKDEEKGQRKKKDEEKRKRKKRRKKKELSILSHSIRACPRILSVQIYAYNSSLLML